MCFSSVLLLKHLSLSHTCFLHVSANGDALSLSVFLFVDIHYFHCLRIVEILKGTEASSKNIFGRYSSQRMKVTCYLMPNFQERIFVSCFYLLLKYKMCSFYMFPQDWQEILTLYEADNLYLGELVFYYNRLECIFYCNQWLTMRRLSP